MIDYVKKIAKNKFHYFLDGQLFSDSNSAVEYLQSIGFSDYDATILINSLYYDLKH